MVKSGGLKPDDQIRCSACGELHIVRLHSDVGSTSTAAKEMLYTFCTVPTIGLYFVGAVGSESNRGPIVKSDNPKGGAR